MKRILIICCIAGLISACSDFLKEYSQDLAKVESFSDLDEVLLGKGYLPWGRSEAGDYGMSTVVDAYFQATHHMADEMAFNSRTGVGDLYLMSCRRIIRWKSCKGGVSRGKPISSGLFIILLW